MSPALIPARRLAAPVRPAPAAPVHWPGAPCTEPGRVTGKPGEVTCEACITWQVEAAWNARHTRTEVSA